MATKQSFSFEFSSTIRKSTFQYRNFTWHIGIRAQGATPCVFLRCSKKGEPFKGRLQCCVIAGGRIIFDKDLSFLGSSPKKFVGEIPSEQRAALSESQEKSEKSGAKLLLEVRLQGSAMVAARSAGHHAARNAVRHALAQAHATQPQTAQEQTVQTTQIAAAQPQTAQSHVTQPEVEQVPETPAPAAQAPAAQAQPTQDPAAQAQPTQDLAVQAPAAVTPAQAQAMWNQITQLTHVALVAHAAQQVQQIASEQPDTQVAATDLYNDDFDNDPDMGILLDLPLEHHPEEYQVQAIVGKRRRNGRIEYKIRWTGYTADDDTWEDIDNCNCDQLIIAFEARERERDKEQDRILSDRERAAFWREQVIAGKQQELSARENLVLQRETALNAREAQLRAREELLERREAQGHPVANSENAPRDDAQK